MIAAYIAACVLAVAVPTLGVRLGVPAYHSWQHGRCLARIAVLERGLDIAHEGVVVVPLTVDSEAETLPPLPLAPSDEAAFWKSHDKEMRRQLKAERERGPYKGWR